MNDSDPTDVRSPSGAIENPAKIEPEPEQQSVADSVSAEALPRIAIADALRNNWFEIWYQPKIDLKRKCLAGAEAFARIRHPELGVLLPGSFLPEVDEASIGELAEQSLLATLCDWPMFEEAGFNLHLAVNVPMSVLPKLPILALVGAYRPPSERWPGLILEVTEDQIVRDIASAKEIAGQLHLSGITIAIDNFGAGGLSFASLGELPFAELKIDRSFVKGCATDPVNAATCQAAVDLAHRCGGAVVAEGLDSMADLQALMVMGCDFGQGVMIAPPMPKEDFLGLLRQRITTPRPVSPKDAMQTRAEPISRVA